MLRTLLAAVFLVFWAGPGLADVAFGPLPAATVNLAVTGTTARVAVTNDAYNPQIRIFNSGTVPVFVTCGDVTVVATLTTGMPLAPGTVEVISCSKGYVAGISAGTAATLYLTPGSGN